MIKLIEDDLDRLLAEEGAVIEEANQISLQHRSRRQYPFSGADSGDRSGHEERKDQ